MSEYGTRRIDVTGAIVYFGDDGELVFYLPTNECGWVSAENPVDLRDWS